jgi:hypothetical protein
LPKLKNFISHYSGSENNLESDIVYFAFAQHLKNKLNPIVDQYTIRAMWLVNTDLTDAEKESCKRYLMDDKKGKWKKSGSGNTAKECLKLYQKFISYLQRKTIDIDKIDKLFMPLGKAIKKKYSNYTVLSEIL